MKIVFDNCQGMDCKASLWGFSAYLGRYKMLFDTGSNGRVLLKNLSRNNISVKDIDYIFISHDHWDHIGGIDSVLELNQNITIFAPSALSKNHIRDLENLSKKVILIGRKPLNLFGNLYSTGMLGEDNAEHSLIINSAAPTLVAGCGHYGIANIVQVARDIIGRDVKRVAGGFHLLDESKENISLQINRLKVLGVEDVLPTHCTGSIAIDMFREVFSNRCLLGGTGTYFKL